MNWAIDLAERRVLPDAVVRVGMRRLLKKRLRSQETGDGDRAHSAVSEFVDEMRREPIAVATDSANEQHYELPPEFFRAVLGPYLKYSSCLWPEGVETLADAEECMLELSCERAGIADGMDVLDLGCGWGSLSLWIASHYPGTRVLAVSNSRDQARFGKEINRSELRPGDLVFFATGGRGVSHVGIYSGSGEFIHASTRARRVRYDRLDNKYFKKRFVVARRIL